MREENLTSFKSDVRSIICKYVKISGGDLAKLTNEIAQAAVPAIDKEVQDVVETCGLVPA